MSLFLLLIVIATLSSSKRSVAVAVATVVIAVAVVVARSAAAASNSLIPSQVVSAAARYHVPRATNEGSRPPGLTARIIPLDVMTLDPAQFGGRSSFEEALQAYALALDAPVPFQE